MSNEEVELLALEVEIDKVAERVKILTIEKLFCLDQGILLRKHIGF